MLRLQQINASAEPAPQLQLVFCQPLDPVSDAPLLQQWLQQFAPLCRLQSEISMDLLLIRFSFCDQPFYLHLEQTLNDTGFIIKQHPGVVMTKLKRLFTRARPEEAEYNILRGILTSVQRFGQKAGDKE